jgi:AbrB family looped-hinge helix DNA binding protein
MIVTIDKAGRVVIPAAVRDRLGLEAGTPLELTVEDAGIRLVASAPPPTLVRRGGRLVARPTLGTTQRPRVDVAALVEEERNRWP